MRIGKFLQRAAVLALATSLLLAGCQNEAPVPASSEEEGLLVGFSMATLKEDRWLRDRDIFSAKAKQEGINVLISMPITTRSGSMSRWWTWWSRG